MRDRTYALAFLAILLVVCLGAFLATVAILSGLGDLIPWGRPTPTILVQNPSPTLPLLPTQTVTPLPNPSTPVAPTSTPLPPATPTPTITTSPLASPTATQGTFSYKILSVDRACGQSTTYIRGTVQDKAGGGIAGVRIHLYNTYGYDEVRETKGGVDAGNYDFVMGTNPGLFTIEVINTSGIPLSLAQTVDYTPGCTAYVNWQKLQ